MTAVETQNNAPTTTATARKQVREQRGPVLRKLAKAAADAQVDFGRELAYVRDHGFTVGEVKAGKLDAYVLTWTGLKPSTWKGYVRVVEILDEIGDKDGDKFVADESARAFVETLPQDGIKLMGPLDGEQRAEYVRKAQEADGRAKGGNGVSTKTLESIRDKIKPRQARNTPDAAAKTEELVATILDQVRAVIGTGEDAMAKLAAMYAGANIQKDYPKSDVPEALMHLIQNPGKLAVTTDEKKDEKKDEETK